MLLTAEPRPLPVALLATASASVILLWSVRKLLRKQRQTPKGVAPEARASLDSTRRHDKRVLLLSNCEKGIVKMSGRSNGLMTVCFRFRVHGPVLRSERLSKALKMLQTRHPLLRCRLDKQSGETVLVERDDVTLPCEFVGGDKLWTDVWSRYEKRPFFVGDPIMRVLVVPHQGQHDLLMLFHHGFADGKSLSHVAHDLFRFIGDPALEPSPLPYAAPIEVVVGEAIGRGIVARIRHMYRLFKCIYALVTLPKGCRFPTDKSVTPQNISLKCSTSFRSIKLSSEESSKLLKACRSHRTTITGALGAALLDAISACLPGGKPAVLATAVDIRKLYKPPMSPNLMGYHISAGRMFQCPHVENRSISQVWDVAKELRSEIVKDLESRVPITVAGFISSQYNNPPVLEHGISTTISNWGVLPFQTTYGPWTLVEAETACNLNYISQPAVLVTTVNGCITVTVMAPIPIVDASALEALTSRYEVRIRGLLDSV